MFRFWVVILKLHHEIEMQGEKKPKAKDQHFKFHTNSFQTYSNWTCAKQFIRIWKVIPPSKTPEITGNMWGWENMWSWTIVCSNRLGVPTSLFLGGFSFNYVFIIFTPMDGGNDSYFDKQISELVDPNSHQAMELARFKLLIRERFRCGFFFQSGGDQVFH